MRFVKKDSYKTIEEVILRNTGYSSMEELLNVEEEPYVYNLDEAVTFVKERVKSDEITIVGDFDCDGDAATSILILALEEYSGKKVSYTIPRRFTQGYGLNQSIVDKINSGLMITVDNGISAVEQIMSAKEKGLKVVIIDHHVKREDGVLPPADVIIDPSAFEDEPDYKYYCGAGLAYRFAKALLSEKSQGDDSESLRVRKLVMKLETLAGLATIADVMTLKGHNRMLVKNSLTNLQNGIATQGTLFLAQAMGLKQGIDEDFYGFNMGPAINAVGRLNDCGGEYVVNLLTKDAEHNSYELFQMENELTEMAAFCHNQNLERQRLSKEALEDALAIISEPNVNDKVIIYYKEDLHEGIIGILAGNLCEKFNRPCIVFTNSKNEGVLKGSGRAIKGIHLKKLLDTVSEYLLGYGGHAGAAGLSLKIENLDIFKDKINENLDYTPQPIDMVEYDLEIEEKDIPYITECLEKYAPFGEGCEKVRFLLKNFTASPKGNCHYKLMGNDGLHMKVIGNKFNVMLFGMAKKYESLDYPKNIDVVGTLGSSYYRGEKYFDIKAIEFISKEEEKAEENKTETFSKMEALFAFI